MAAFLDLGPTPVHAGCRRRILADPASAPAQHVAHRRRPIPCRPSRMRSPWRSRTQQSRHGSLVSARCSPSNHRQRLSRQFRRAPQPRVLDHELLAALPGGDRPRADALERDRDRRVRRLAPRRRHQRRVLPREHLHARPGHGAAAQPTPSPPILINPHEHRIIDTNHRDLVRVSIFGTSGFPVSDDQSGDRRARRRRTRSPTSRARSSRDEFPFADLRLRRRPVEPARRLDHRDPDGPDQQWSDVRNAEGRAQPPGFGPGLRPVEEVHGERVLLQEPGQDRGEEPLRPAISVSSTPVTAVSRNPAARGAAAIKVDYTPKVSASAARAAEQAEAVKVRPVVSIKRADAASSERTCSDASSLQHGPLS